MAAPLVKPLRADRTRAKRKRVQELHLAELTAKREVRKRDGHCRFPLCGCWRLGLPLEVSHDQHKGMGGNPAGDRSLARDMILLCQHRHQSGRISRHKGTLRAVYLTPRHANGPLAWEVDMRAYAGGSGEAQWFEVARESAVGLFEPPTPAQLFVLRSLGEMRSC